MKIFNHSCRSSLIFIFLVMALTTTTGSIYGSNSLPNTKSEKIPSSKNLPKQQDQISPLETIDFNSNQIFSRSHPFLFYSEFDIKKAREHSRDVQYNKPMEILNTEANKARDIILYSLDRTWWDEVKTKPWSDTYPIIYEKTCLVPLRIVQPAYYAALRFIINEDPTDAKTAMQILLHLSDYSFEFKHYDVGMNYSVWGYFALNVYDILFNCFSPNERTKIDAFFTRMGQAIMKNDIYWIENNIGGGINNHLAWHKMMLGCLGIFYGQNKFVDYALLGPRGLLSLLELGLVDDGLWCESSLNYHFTAIVPMVYLGVCPSN